MPQRTILMRLRNFVEHIPDSLGVTLSTNTTIVAGGTGITSALLQLNWTAIIASTVAILGLIMNYYFNHRQAQRDKEHKAREQMLSAARERREQERHEAELARIKKDCNE